MPALMVICPLTGKSVPVGIETEPEVFLALPRVQAALQCPACGEKHFWTCEDAMLSHGGDIVSPLSTAERRGLDAALRHAI
jgi:hypothetical protein